ncbi:heavy-metal-associated domain-containing protein [Pseudomonas sp. MBLB4136]|uniref:heavy-metal-associated domain-containing protein n=1 Tax=Pseudomonas sp. MBLB4136 TaxID=3451558 RepID=UPI003F74BCF8
MQVFKVQGMSCGHCVRAITDAVRDRDPLAEVQVDLVAGEVRIDSPLPSEALIEAIFEEGYSVSLA